MSVKHSGSPDSRESSPGSVDLDPATLQKLMAYADGELDGAERIEIEALVKANHDAARVLEELSVLGDCMRIVAETHPIVMPTGMVDAVMARLQEDAKPTVSVERTMVGSEASTSRARVVDLASRRRRTYGAIAGLVAAAAAVVLVARITNEETPTASTRAVAAVTAPAPSPAAPPASSVAMANPVEKPASEKPGDLPSSVSVILVPSEGETASSIVIWLGEESPSGGPVK